MRGLERRLSLSHGALVALVTLALAVTGQGLLRILNVIVTVRETQLESLGAEESIHRAGWAVEVAARHGLAACEKGNALAAEAGMRVARDRLTKTMNDLGTTPAAHPAIIHCAKSYLSFADRVLGKEAPPPEAALCTSLKDPEAARVRFQIDEDMTDAWIDRQREFLSDIVASELEVRSIAVSATALGVGIAILAAFVAIWVARTTAASVTVPIRQLAAATPRLGEPDAPPIAITDAPREILELARDLERAHNRLLEIDGLKQSFLANVSHELRTPLARLREALSLLSDKTMGDLSQKQARILSLAQRACEEEVRLVNSLLDLSRMRSGAPIRKQPHVIVGDVAQAAIDEEREYASKRGTLLTLESTGSVVLDGDPSLIERAIVNLVRNAVSVSRAGDSVRLELATDGNLASLLVIDSGPGVPEEIRKTLFTPFVAAPVAGFERSLSLGLGLSFAREVALAHGGDLVLVSSNETGTTFRITFAIGQEKS